MKTSSGDLVNFREGHQPDEKLRRALIGAIEMVRELERADLPIPNDLDPEMRSAIASAASWRLIVDEPTLPTPWVSDTGNQFVERGGEVPFALLDYLPNYVDDFDAREALLVAGSRMGGIFASAIRDGLIDGAAFYFLPRGFLDAIDEELAIRMFGALSALQINLLAERPASCVAEEILAVSQQGLAIAYLKEKLASEPNSEERISAAVHATRGIFELFQDDDVLELFDMDEPADAAVLSASEKARNMGMVDVRLEAWFEPLWGNPPVGHMSDLWEVGYEE